MSTGDRPQLIVTTGNEVQGHEIAEYLGVVRGIVVRATSITQGLRGAFKSFVGGNVAAYEEVCEAARQDAFKRMAKQAREIGADAIIGMRYDATEFQQGTTEVLAYGTAVTLRKG
ncbi:MAG TPA: YbjQ family protein [Gemmataceae bacterium]|nr:YbjQ family protein [Gemmataceae bacterium]